MAVISGRNGQVLWDPAGLTATVPILSLNAWSAEFKTEFEDVTTFGAVNREYIPGMKDAGGEIAGFWNSAELALFEAAESDVPGLLKLVPSTTEATFFWSGKAYLDASIDASLSAPKVSGTWKAAGPFVLAGGTLLTALARETEARRRDKEAA